MEIKAQEIKEKSFAYELLQDQRKQNRRLFIMWVITFLAFLGMLGYTIYLLNDVGTIETTQEVTQESDNGDNNFIGRDGDING